MENFQRGHYNYLNTKVRNHSRKLMQLGISWGQNLVPRLRIKIVKKITQSPNLKKMSSCIGFLQSFLSFLLRQFFESFLSEIFQNVSAKRIEKFKRYQLNDQLNQIPSINSHYSIHTVFSNKNFVPQKMVFWISMRGSSKTLLLEGASQSKQFFIYCLSRINRSQAYRNNSF